MLIEIIKVCVLLAIKKCEQSHKHFCSIDNSII